MSYTAARRIPCVAVTLGVVFGAGSLGAAQSQPATIQLVVDAGRPLRLIVDETVTVKQVGQPVTAALADPVYAYDRIVLPAGTKAAGEIHELERAPKSARVRGALGGDFSVPRRVKVLFHQLTLPDGRTISIRTAATEGIPGPTSKSARLKAWAIDSLPVHPQFLRTGTIFSARLESPIDFGDVTSAGPGGATDAAAAGNLNARLLTPIDSSTARPGAPIEAIITEPVVSADGRLILPEGTKLTGQVTFAKPARRLHRHGQLRVLFDTVHLSTTSEKLLATLHAVDTGAVRVAIDEEGGATMTSSNARFVAPALSALALAGAMHGRLDYDTDGAPPEMAYGGATSNYVGGFIGAGVLGAVLSQLSRPVMIGITVAGLARTTYSSILGKGREVSFPLDTPIQLQLAPGAGGKKQ